MPGPLSEGVKKNLLDLQYAKYLQYYTTAVIILFTYGIGVAIAFITKQIDFYSIGQMLLVFLISMAVVSVVVMLMLDFKGHLSNITAEIKKLDV